MKKNENLALAACRLVIEWAGTPSEHGGNPYCKPFVRVAQEALYQEAKRNAPADREQVLDLIHGRAK